MTAHVLRIGAIAFADDHADRQVLLLQRLFSPEEFTAWRADFERGRWVFVCLRLFADVADVDGVTRHYEGVIDSLQFGRPHDEDNLDHARETLPMGLPSLASSLADAGIATSRDALGRAPVAIELDPALLATLN